MPTRGLMAATVTPWANWDEWSEAYASLFALDEPARRTEGVRCVELWRLRGLQTLPLAVDATATFVELLLLDADRGASEHALCHMYAMAVTRLVNGIVDPLQQGARAASVKALAKTVGLPAALVELRHECTHNRLPSIGRLRLASDQALLWLHEHYWLPQRSMLDGTVSAVRECLREYHAATSERCATGEPPLRKHVMACAVAVDKALPATQIANRLIPLLLDGGFLIPPHGATTDNMTATTAAATATAAAASSGEGDSALSPVRSMTEDELQRRVWAPLIARLARLWPQHHLPTALLLGAARRLADEGALPPTDGPGAAVASDRLLALQGWCVHLLESTDSAHQASDGDLLEAVPDGGLDSSVLDPSALVQTAWLAARAHHGWGRPLIVRTLRHATWPSPEARASTRRLMQLQDVAEKARLGQPSPVMAGEGGDEPVPPELHTTRDAMSAVATKTLAPPLLGGGPWRVCSHWVPTAIGAPPPPSALAAAIAPMPDALAAGDGINGMASASALDIEVEQRSRETGSQLPALEASAEEDTEEMEPESSQLNAGIDAQASAESTVANDFELRILYRRPSVSTAQSEDTPVETQTVTEQVGAAGGGGRSSKRSRSAAGASQVSGGRRKSKR